MYLCRVRITIKQNFVLFAPLGGQFMHQSVLLFLLQTETSCAIPILMVAALLLSGGLLSIKLPNTSNAALA